MIVLVGLKGPRVKDWLSTHVKLLGEGRLTSAQIVPTPRPAVQIRSVDVIGDSIELAVPASADTAREGVEAALATIASLPGGDELLDVEGLSIEVAPTRRPT